MSKHKIWILIVTGVVLLLVLFFAQSLSAWPQ